MCQSGATCLPADCCFSEIALYNPTKHVVLVQSGHHHHSIECNLFSPWYSWLIVHLALNNTHSHSNYKWVLLIYNTHTHISTRSTLIPQLSVALSKRDWNWKNNICYMIMSDFQCNWNIFNNKIKINIVYYEPSFHYLK
jgi:hypothetical protein